MRAFNRILTGAAVLLATALPASAAMAAPADVIRNDTFTTFVNTCTNEPETVDLTGTLHQIFHFNADGSWVSTLSIRTTGIGDQGNSYVVKENNRVKVGSGNVDVQDYFRMTSTGSAPDLLVFIKFTVSGGVFDITVKSVCAG